MGKRDDDRVRLPARRFLLFLISIENAVHVLQYADHKRWFLKYIVITGKRSSRDQKLIFGLADLEFTDATSRIQMKFEEGFKITPLIAVKMP